MICLEKRLKLELHSVGLLDDDDLDMDSKPREDDEICSEIRIQQKLLKEQIAANNLIKQKLMESVMEQIQKEQPAKNQTAITNANYLSQLQKLLKKKNKQQ